MKFIAILLVALSVSPARAGVSVYRTHQSPNGLRVHHHEHHRGSSAVCVDCGNGAVGLMRVRGASQRPVGVSVIRTIIR